MALAVKRFGGLDIVVNNAAILRDAFMFKLEPRDWDAVIQHQPVRAALRARGGDAGDARATPRAERGGKPYGWGRIVNIVSTAGLYGNYGQAAYAAAKAGLVGLTRVTALDMARSDITCQRGRAVRRDPRHRIDQARQRRRRPRTRRARMKVPAAHVADLRRAICARRPAQKITGQIFGVRGREVFLFSQPRPVARMARPTATGRRKPSTRRRRARARAASSTELATDLEAFNTEPIV